MNEKYYRKSCQPNVRVGENGVIIGGVIIGHNGVIYKSNKPQKNSILLSVKDYVGKYDESYLCKGF